MPTDEKKTEQPAPTLAELLRAHKKKLAAERRAAVVSYGWSLAQTLLVVGAGAALFFFAWPALGLLPFIGVAVGTGIGALLTGIFGKIKNNFLDGEMHSYEAARAGAHIKTVQTAISKQQTLDIEHAAKTAGRPAPAPAQAPASAPAAAPAPASAPAPQIAAAQAAVANPAPAQAQAR